MGIISNVRPYLNIMPAYGWKPRTTMILVHGFYRDRISYRGSAIRYTVPFTFQNQTYTFPSINLLFS